MTTISIDTSGLMRLRPEREQDSPSPKSATQPEDKTKNMSFKKEPETELIKHLKTKITVLIHKLQN